MKTAITAATFIALWAVSAVAEPPTPEQLKELDATCAKAPCRAGGFDVAVFMDATHLLDVPVGRSPIITPDGDILIYPGETIAVQFTVTDDTLSAPRLLAQYATDPSFAMKIESDSKLIDNPLDASLPSLPQKDPATDLPVLPPDTLLITYGQSKDMAGMAMIFETNLPRTLKLDATMSLIRKGGYEWRKTSTCPLIAKTSFESWPGPLGPMKLSHFRFLPDGAKTSCE